MVGLFRAVDHVGRKRGSVSLTYLVADPSFLTGVARTLDLWGHLDAYNMSQTPQEADALAIRHDWKIVGRELFVAAKLHQKRAASKRAGGNE